MDSTPINDMDSTSMDDMGDISWGYMNKFKAEKKAEANEARDAAPDRPKTLSEFLKALLFTAVTKIASAIFCTIAFTVICGVYFSTAFLMPPFVAFKAISVGAVFCTMIFHVLRPANIAWALRNPTTLLKMIWCLVAGTAVGFAAAVRRRIFPPPPPSLPFVPQDSEEAAFWRNWEEAVHSF